MRSEHKSAQCGGGLFATTKCEDRHLEKQSDVHIITIVEGVTSLVNLKFANQYIYIYIYIFFCDLFSISRYWVLGMSGQTEIWSFSFVFFGRSYFHCGFGMFVNFEI